MHPATHCPACGATWIDETTCETHFHQMLFWEWEDPVRWNVHHLMVLCFHLQHPYLYSPEMLMNGIGMLVDFVENGVTPQQMRQQIRASVDSGKRTHTLTACPGHQGAYAHLVIWGMTAADVVAAGAGAYVESVEHWARSILSDLRESLNLSAKTE